MEPKPARHNNPNPLIRAHAVCNHSRSGPNTRVAKRSDPNIKNIVNPKHLQTIKDRNYSNNVIIKEATIAGSDRHLKTNNIGDEEQHPGGTTENQSQTLIQKGSQKQWGGGGGVYY